MEPDVSVVSPIVFLLSVTQRALSISNFTGEMPCPTLEVYGKTFSKRGYNFVGSAKVPYADLSVSDITEVGAFSAILCVARIPDLILHQESPNPTTFRYATGTGNRSPRPRSLR